ncbi:MAG: D-alanyl-D-alanine carboxypeptidase [Candidatus Woesebacteria bacterium]|jgi:D-alanyl-D-alanine carboxypeptidase (penicillin-binding protein 5/6)
MALRPKYKKPKKRRFRLLIFCIAAIGGLVFWFYQQGQRFDQGLSAQTTSTTPKRQKIALESKPSEYIASDILPEGAQAAAIGITDDGNGVIAASGDTEPRPIASIAKVITAMALLEKYPLKPGEEGPQIDISESDEQLYLDYVAKNGTAASVKAGVSITLYDALEAMLLMSANNIADTAAIWGFGSMDEYHMYANRMLYELELEATQVGGDASGFDPQTISTPSDLVRLGETAMKNPVFAEIVGSPGGYMPYAGDIPNYNGLVNKHGFSGIKHGDSLQADITVLFSTQKNINGKEVTVVGTILGAETYAQINQMAINLVDTVEPK